MQRYNVSLTTRRIQRKENQNSQKETDNNHGQLEIDDQTNTSLQNTV